MYDNNFKNGVFDMKFSVKNKKKTAIQLTAYILSLLCSMLDAMNPDNGVIIWHSIGRGGTIESVKKHVIIFAPKG